MEEIRVRDIVRVNGEGRTMVAGYVKEGIQFYGNVLKKVEEGVKAGDVACSGNRLV